MRSSQIVTVGVANSSVKASRASGFAMVTALLVLVAVGALATGAFTLSVFNNRLAQNVQTQAIARYNAERGLDAALLTVAQLYGQLVEPTSEESEPPEVPSVALFEEYWRSLDAGDARFVLAEGTDELPAGYRPSGTTAEIIVRGFAESDGRVLAEHTATARFSAVSVLEPDSETTPTTGPGFVTSGSINVAGKGQYNLNIHAGTDVEVEGTGYVGFTYKSGTRTCQLSTFIDPDTGETVNTVTCERNQAPPVVEVFNWDQERLKYGDGADQRPCDETIQRSDLNRQGQTFTYSPNLESAAERVYCLAEDIDVAVSFSGRLSNAVIVGSQTQIVNILGGSAPPAGDPEGLGVRVIAGGVQLVGTNAALTGMNQIYSYSNVILDRAVTRLVDDDDPAKRIVGTVIKSGRDVVHRGDGNVDTYAQIVANRAFCRAGNANADFIGSVEVSLQNVTEVNIFGTGSTSCFDTHAIDFRGGSAANFGFIASLPDEFRTRDDDDDETLVNRPSQIRVDFRR